MGSSAITMLAGDITLIHEVSIRYYDLRDMHRRVLGTDLVPPTDLDGAFQRFNALKERCYLQNDFRMYADEKSSVRTIAQWLVDEKCRLCGQPTKEIPWVD